MPGDPSPGRESFGDRMAGRESFGDRVAGRVAERNSQLVLGLDPDPARLWPGALEGPAGAAGAFTSAGREAHAATPAERAAGAVRRHCHLVLDAVAEVCVAVKLQVACFERLGAPGWAALSATVEAARDRGLLVIADAKRGDIDVSAKAYGQAFFGETPTPFGSVPGLGADALTVNPLLGVDSLSPLVDAARERAGGLFVLVRTSNPGARDVQELRLSGGGAVSDELARIVSGLGVPGVGSAGLADVGAVLGATAPARVAALRDAMPRAILLLPGVGPQGGEIEALAPAFAPGRAGGLIAASRAIVCAHERNGGEPAGAAAREAARLRELTWRISG